MLILDRRPHAGRLARWAAILASLASIHSTAFSQEKIASLDTFTAILENDILVGSDADYSGGVELAWSFAAESSFAEVSGLPKWCMGLARLTPLGKRQYDLVGSNIALGQKVFTPHNLRTAEIIPDDRPYAGWSYLNFALHGRRREKVDTMAISLGMIGPDSFAEDVQRAVHRFLDDLQAAGWDNQLGNEIGLAASLDQDRRRWSRALPADYAAELIESRSITLGNVDTSASLETRLRFGRNLPSDYKEGRIAHAVLGFEPTTAAVESTGGRCYFEAAIGGRYVAQNIFLDGNTFEDSHSVEKRNWVGTTSVGLHWERRKTRVSLTYNYTTKEFETQRGGSAYASLAVSTLQSPRSRRDRR